MTELHFYMPAWLHDRAQREETIFGRIKQAADLAGWTLVLHGEDDLPMPRG